MARIVKMLGTAVVVLVALGALGGPAARACDVVTSVVAGCPPEETPPPDDGAGEQPEPAPREAQEPAAPRVARQAAERLHELIDRDRAAAGLPALDRRDDVRTIAEEHGMRMADAGRIWHNDDYFTAENRQRLGARSLGENVALNSDVDDAHRRLMASEGHRANILSSSFTAVGIGVVRDGNGRYFVTQGFLEAAEPAPVRGAATPAPAPASGPSPPGPAPSPAPAPAAGAGDAGAGSEVADPATGAVDVRGAALRLPDDPPLGSVAAPAPRRSAPAPAAASSAVAAGLGLAALLAAVGLAVTFQRRALVPA